MMSNLYFSCELILPSISNKSLAFKAITGSLTQETPRATKCQAHSLFLFPNNFCLRCNLRTGKENRRVNRQTEMRQRPYVSLFPRSQSMGNLFKICHAMKMACHAVTSIQVISRTHSNRFCFRKILMDIRAFIPHA